MWVEERTTSMMLITLEFAYPAALTAFFLLAFIIHSIAMAPKTEIPSEADQVGPGGKPLPRRKKFDASQMLDFGPAQQSLFKWLSALLVSTFAVDTALTISHVIAARSDGWWCGQHFVVSTYSRIL